MPETFWSVSDWSTTKKICSSTPKYARAPPVARGDWTRCTMRALRGKLVLSNDVGYCWGEPRAYEVHRVLIEIRSGQSTAHNKQSCIVSPCSIDPLASSLGPGTGIRANAGSTWRGQKYQLTWEKNAELRKNWSVHWRSIERRDHLWNKMVISLMPH